MPKFLFYIGVASTLLLALASFATARALLDEVTSSTGIPAALLSPIEASASSGSTLALLLLILPVAALFVRMASLLAARDLFASFFALFLVSCTALAFFVVALLRIPLKAAPIAPGVSLAGLVVLGGLLSLTFLVLRSYFKVQASRVLQSLAFFPLPIFFWGIVETLSDGGLSVRSDSSPLFLYLLVLGALFFSVALHSMRHRHLFIEVTNLRELLEPPADPASLPAGARPVGFGGDIAFHH